MSEHATATRKPRPPTLAILLLVASWLVQRYQFPALRLPDVFRPLGFALMVAGFVMGAKCLNRFRARGTTHHPFETPTVLICDGPYLHSRNPMYLAVALTMAGCAFGTASPVLLAAPVIFLLILNVGYVPAEERALEAAFGDAYRAYRGNVRRWI